MSIRAQLAGVVALNLLAVAGAVCTAPTTLTCSKSTTPVTFDADLSEWAGVVGIATPIRNLSGVDWAAGNAVFKCTHNTTHVNFALLVPGAYKFDKVDSHKCAITSLMFKVGADATYYNMGGCPDQQNKSTCGALKASGQCTTRTVDVVRFGGKATQRGRASSAQPDQHGFSSYCYTTDNSTGGGNEWVAAWDHSNPAGMAMGNYTFELTRSLTTTSSAEDVQLAINNTYSFGVGFWDPMETATGWTDEGHYITGCGLDWINLVVGNGMLNTDVHAGHGTLNTAYVHANGIPDVGGKSVCAAFLFAMVWAVMMSQ